MYQTAQDLRAGVIRPTLLTIQGQIPQIRHAQNVEDLLVMIAAHESHLGKHRRQIGGGPARGLYQIEIPTHEDLYDNYLKFRPGYLEAVSEFFHPDNDRTWSLEHDDAYATVVARFLLWRKREKIPTLEQFQDSADPKGAYLLALATYAKKHWNTEGGAATPEKYLTDFIRFS